MFIKQSNIWQCFTESESLFVMTFQDHILLEGMQQLQTFSKKYIVIQWLCVEQLFYSTQGRNYYLRACQRGRVGLKRYSTHNQ